MNALMELKGIPESAMEPQAIQARREMAAKLIDEGMSAENIRLKVKEQTGVGISTRFVRAMAAKKKAAQWGREERRALAMDLAKQGMRYQAIYDTVKKQTGKCVSAEFVLGAIRAAGIVETKSKPRTSFKVDMNPTPPAATVVTTEATPLSDIDMLRGLESLFRGVSDASASRIFKAYLVLGGAP